jgi:phage I-like protein
MTSPRLVLLDSASERSDEPGGALLLAVDLVELADGTKSPPKEFKILAAGVNETTKGPVIMNATAGQSVLARMKDLGRDQLNFDYGHAQLGFMQSYEAARSAGWFSVEVRGEELWATNVNWTPTAAKALSDREFRYFSPALYLDRESGEVRELINIALTNIPATKHQTPLVASQTPESKDMDPELKALLACMGVMNLSQLAVKCQTLASDNDKLVKAAGEMQAQLAQATAALATFNAEKSKAEKADYVAQLSTAGKLPPALRDWALGQDLAVLKSFADAAPVVSAASPTTTTTPKPAGTDGAAMLSDDEKKLCKMMNLSEADFLATKKELLAGPTIWAYDPNANAPAPAVKETK